MSQYQPIQFNHHISYQQQAPLEPALASMVAYYWQIHCQSPQNYLVVPDGCVDLLLNCSHYQGFFIAPSKSQATHFELAPNETWFGIRFYPLAFTYLFGGHIGELKEETLFLAEVINNWANAFDSALFEASHFEQRMKVANQFLLKKLSSIQLFPDHRLQRVIQYIYQQGGNISLKNTGSLTLSERQLRRLFKHHIGLSPKEFARIIRFQHYLQSNIGSSPDPKAFYHHYYDQSHFIKEIKMMTQKTPKQLWKMLKQPYES